MCASEWSGCVNLTEWAWLHGRGSARNRVLKAVGCAQRDGGRLSVVGGMMAAMDESGGRFLA